MGGSQSSQKSESQMVMEAMTVLADSKTSQAERQPHFDWLRRHLAPDISRSQAFSEELSRTFALRYKQWAAPPHASSWSDHQRARLADRIRGLLFGAALGDAAGLATEFLDKQTALSHYGESPDFAPGAPVFADTHRLNFPVGDWTDDTDQQVLLLQSLLETQGHANPKDFAQRLSRWKEEGFAGLGDQSGSGLGATTKAVITRSGFLDDPHAIASAVWEARGRDLASNGAVMRTAIVGASHFWDLEKVEQNTVDFCRVTHADPRCISSCVLVTAIVAMYLQSLAHEDSREDKEEQLQEPLEAGEAGADQRMLRDAIERAVAPAYLGESSAYREELLRHASAETLEELRLDETRVIGYTFKCLGAGLWAWRNAIKLGFNAVINQVVAEAGDADTNAAVAGALAGCRLGYSRLPKAWIDQMPYTSWLEAWVQKLLFMLELPVAAHDTPAAS